MPRMARGAGVPSGVLGSLPSTVKLIVFGDLAGSRVKSPSRLNFDSLPPKALSASGDGLAFQFTLLSVNVMLGPMALNIESMNSGPLMSAETAFQGPWMFSWSDFRAGSRPTSGTRCQTASVQFVPLVENAVG